jgi:hypothetical protein
MNLSQEGGMLMNLLIRMMSLLAMNLLGREGVA